MVSGSFLVGCREFEQDQLVLLDDMCRTEGARGWLDQFWREDVERMMALL